MRGHEPLGRGCRVMQRLSLPIIIAVLLSFAGGIAIGQVVLSQSSGFAAKAAGATTDRGPRPERVMAIGASVALGHLARHDDGYLQRAFQFLSGRTSIGYRLYDKAISGANSTQLATLYKGDYTKWLDSIRPQIVVISWGLINDALPDTPVSRFDSYLRQEIKEALARRAVVYVVTPPVTEVAYTQFKTQIQGYVRDERLVVASLHDPNVRFFNVFAQMKAYIASHHVSFMRYVGDAHHPNTQGHALAGRLLYQDILRRVSREPIRFSNVT